MMRWPTMTAAATALALTGCPQPGDPSELGVDDGTPLTVKDTLVYFSEAEQRAVLVNVAGDEPRVRRVDLPDGPCEARPRPGSDGHQLVVLCAGADATVDSDAAPAQLLVFDRGGIARRYELPGRFGQFSLSEDGRHAFVFDARGGIVLATETAFVDLREEAGDDNPVGVTVRSLSGESPTGAVFSPPMEVAGESRRFAVALSPGHVNLFDLAHLERGAVTVPLSVDGNANVTPEEVLFGARTVYVRASGLDHVLALALHEARDDGDSPHPYAPSLSTLALGERISRILLLERDDGRELVLALTPSTVSVIDVATGTPVRIPVGSSFNQAVRFRGGSPGDDNVRERALLYGEDNRIGFLDLERLEILQGRNLETLDVPAAVTGASPMVEQGRVALLHADETLLSVVELEDRTVVPVRTQVSLQNALVDAERARLWLRTDGERVATLSLADLSTAEVLLDASVRDLLLLPGDEPSLVAVHDDPTGYVTLLDPGAPARSSARSLQGFLWEGLFDERTNAP